MPPNTCIILFCLLTSLSPLIRATFNLTLPHQHPNPEAVVQEVQRRLNVSISRRQMLSTTTTNNGGSKDQLSCLTGNPIDDCWRCDPNWANNRQRLADCAIGFGHAALGGKGGQIYVVTDSSDDDPANPTPGTLRYGVIQSEPLWIIFSGNMLIKLKHELIMNSFKTIDGRGANIQITGGGCITLQYISNVIIHNIHVSNCIPSGNTMIRSTPTHVGHRGISDGDGISIFNSHDLWIDHCSLSYCKDGLIDAIMGSTGITISNSYFAHHNEVMLLGHDDKYLPDSGMQVTIAFNHFGVGLVQRMPRCRRGYIHVVNNDFTEWKMYAIGGSANPTINSQGNRYTAPVDPDAKEVTKRVDTNEKDWTDWNWRTDGDIMVNGAFFVPSGQGLTAQYTKASSVEPKSAALITQLTSNSGVFGDPRGLSSLSQGSLISLSQGSLIRFLHLRRDQPLLSRDEPIVDDELLMNPRHWRHQLSRRFRNLRQYVLRHCGVLFQKDLPPRIVVSPISEVCSGLSIWGFCPLYLLLLLPSMIFAELPLILVGVFPMRDGSDWSKLPTGLLVLKSMECPYKKVQWGK